MSKLNKLEFVFLLIIFLALAGGVFAQYRWEPGAPLLPLATNPKMEVEHKEQYYIRLQILDKDKKILDSKDVEIYIAVTH